LPELRATALEGIAVEAYLSGRAERALECRRELLALHEAAGDRLRTGDDLRWLSRLLWWTGDGPAAAAMGDRAIAVLEAFPESAELAQALSARSQLAMLAEQSEDAITLGTRAAELAGRVGDGETVAHALTNVGTALLGGPEHDRGRALLEEAHALALQAGHDEHAARALNNLAASWYIRRRDDPRAAADIARGLRFALERELDPYAQYILGMRAALHLLHGDWVAAEEDARRSIELSEQPVVTMSPALVTAGRLQARRGHPGAAATLDRAWRLAEPTAELQRLAPAAAARAELAWLAGDLDSVAAAAAPVYELACRHGRPWPRAELAAWLRRAGRQVEADADDPPPYALAAAGDWRASAAAWAAIGFPYERAEALAQAGDGEARREALAVFEQLGATRAAARLRDGA
jgi:tetratricopeptide (TPR) repeat protein